MSKQSILITLNVETTNLSGDIYETTLTHPNLTGKLSFVHNDWGKTQLLQTLDENPIANLFDLVATVQELTNGLQKRPRPEPGRNGNTNPGGQA